MLTLKPDGRVDLEHRATFFLRGNSRIFLATSHDRLLSVVHPATQTVQLIQLPEKIRSACPHPMLEILAWIDGSTGSLHFQEFNRAGSRASEWLLGSINEGWEDCHFSDTGDYLWLVANRAGRQCDVQLVESRSGRLVDRATIDDPFGGSSCSFHPCGQPGMIALWLAAGQDGQQVYWLQHSGSGILCTLERHLTNTTPPVFSPSGRSFLKRNQCCEISRVDFNTMKQIGPSLTSQCEDEPFAESCGWLDERWVLAGTGEGRVYAIDTKQMQIEQEVAIECHEPRSIGYYYPALAKETGLGTDISHFEQLGELIVFVYRREPKSILTNWKDSLLWFLARWPF